jgi:uracil-DNA glycosylase
MARIFINYRRQDSEGYVGRLYDHLTRHFEPESLFLDIDSIPPGVDFVEFLDSAVAGCDVLLAVIGPGWSSVADDEGERRILREDDFVRIEIASALRQKKTVIPLLVGGAKMPRAGDLPEDVAGLARRNAMELSHTRFGADVDKLADAVKETVRHHIKPRASTAEVARKTAALKDLRARLVAASDSPLYDTRTEGRFFPVMGEGSADAALLFIGESPGKTEAQAGRPFVGQSGQVLDEMLATIGLRRDNIFITNLILDHPGGKREPTAAEIAYYETYLDQIVDIIRPVVIVPLGRFAAWSVMKKFGLPEADQKISEMHGKLVLAHAPYGQIHVVPLYHPAAVLYSAGMKSTLRQDFQKLKLFL